MNIMLSDIQEIKDLSTYIRGENQQPAKIGEGRIAEGGARRRARICAPSHAQGFLSGLLLLLTRVLTITAVITGRRRVWGDRFETPFRFRTRIQTHPRKENNTGNLEQITGN